MFLKRGFVQRTDEVTALTYRLGKNALKEIREADYRDGPEDNGGERHQTSSFKLAEDATTMTSPGASSSDEIVPMGWTAGESKKDKELLEEQKAPAASQTTSEPKPNQPLPQMIEIKINPQTRDVDVNYTPSPDEIVADIPENTPEEAVVHEPKEPQDFQKLETDVGY